MPSFAIISSTESTEHKYKGILSLNLKKLASCLDDLKIILIL